MAYIVSRKNRFYVVAYDGIDPVTGKERRKWLPAGHARTDAEAILTVTIHSDQSAPNISMTSTSSSGPPEVAKATVSRLRRSTKST